jgi:hypothetical protein
LVSALRLQVGLIAERGFYRPLVEVHSATLTVESLRVVHWRPDPLSYGKNEQLSSGLLHPIVRTFRFVRHQEVAGSSVSARKVQHVNISLQGELSCQFTDVEPDGCRLVDSSREVSDSELRP